MKHLIKFLISPFCFGVDLTCTDNLSLENTPFPCGNDKFGYPVTLFFAKPGTSITAVGNVPTVAEISTALGLTTSSKLIAINPISDGNLTPEPMKIQGPDDLSEVINTKVTITGVLRYLNDATIDDLRQLSVIHKRLQFWFVDNFGRFYGAKAGYRASLTLSPFPKKEFGNASKAGIDMTVEFYLNDTVTFVTALDTAYLDLDNA